ncbi:hypothetical protein QYF36_008983 [Acer negundo]|nr:hypothetical protein QYF36_008983 [Acer negundo]
MSSDKWRPGPNVGGSTDRSTRGGNNESDELNVFIDLDRRIFSEEENKQLDSLDTALEVEAKAGQSDSAKPKIQKLLQLIMQSTSPSKEEVFLESINKFIFDYIRIPGERYRNNDQILKDNPVHLLDILRKMLIQPIHEISKKPNLIIELIIDLAAYLLYKLKCIDKKSEYWHSYRSIEDLREAGINLKPGQTSCVRDITFNWGTLKLPPIVDLHDYFKGRWSLIAFIGAFLALASSIIQTVYTVLAYHVDSNKDAVPDNLPFTLMTTCTFNTSNRVSNPLLHDS